MCLYPSLDYCRVYCGTCPLNISQWPAGHNGGHFHQIWRWQQVSRTSQYRWGEDCHPDGQDRGAEKARIPIKLRQKQWAALPWGCRPLAAIPLGSGEGSSAYHVSGLIWVLCPVWGPRQKIHWWSRGAQGRPLGQWGWSTHPARRVCRVGSGSVWSTGSIRTPSRRIDQGDWDRILAEVPGGMLRSKR